MRLVLLACFAALLQAQSPLAQRGAEIFRTTCGVAYCHGPQGTAGRAPQLAGRAFNPTDLFSIILDGKPGTSMPPFSQQLKSEDIEAVTQYVLSLSGPAAAGPAKTTGKPLPPAAEKGRELFFDALRMGGCGTCHELDERGSPIGPDLKSLAAAQIRNLRSGSQARAVTARPVDEAAFPAIVVEQTGERIRVYDLSSPLPVLRSFRPQQVRITPGSQWSHATATKSYSDAELESIASYLGGRMQSGK